MGSVGIASSSIQRCVYAGAIPGQRIEAVIVEIQTRTIVVLHVRAFECVDRVSKVFSPNPGPQERHYIQAAVLGFHDGNSLG